MGLACILHEDWGAGETTREQYGGVAGVRWSMSASCQDRHPSVREWQQRCLSSRLIQIERRPLSANAAIRTTAMQAGLASFRDIFVPREPGEALCLFGLGPGRITDRRRSESAPLSNNE